MDLVTSTYVSRVGRLGNSLMQIATTLAYGSDHKKKPVFTKWDYQDYIKLDVRPELEINWSREAEHGLSYKTLNFKEGNVDLHGHFLSEDYFKHHRDLILKTIKLKSKYEKYIEENYGELLSKKTCSIHVRRKDYLQPDQKNTHGVLGIDYYDKAMSLFTDTTFVVCSDDIEWCKHNLPNCVYIEGEKDIIDLFIMSKCKSNIIANSTFSWWSAWLNNGNVVAPRNFFVDGHSWPGLYRENWLRI
jgi:hypothetical protein